MMFSSAPPSGLPSSFAGARERAGRGLLTGEIGFAPEMTRAMRGHAAHFILIKPKTAIYEGGHERRDHSIRPASEATKKTF